MATTKINGIILSESDNMGDYDKKVIWETMIRCLQC